MDTSGRTGGAPVSKNVLDVDSLFCIEAEHVKREWGRKSSPNVGLLTPV